MRGAYEIAGLSGVMPATGTSAGVIRQTVREASDSL